MLVRAMAVKVPRVVLNNKRQMPMLGLGTFMAADELIEPMLDAALEAGYRYIDTGFWFCNEEDIGLVLAKWLRSGRIKREELFISTRLPSLGNRAECVQQHLASSLEKLQLSYVDLYSIELPFGFLEMDIKEDIIVLDMATDIISIWKAMEAQVDAGRTHSIGVCNFNSSQLKRIFQAARIPPAVLQVELNVYLQQKEMVGFCKALDVTVCAYAPLGSPDLPLFLKLTGKIFSRHTPPNVLSDPVVQSIAQKHNKTAAQILLRHLVQRGIVSVPKSMHPCRIRENIQVFDFQLDEDDMDLLYVLDKGRRAQKFVGNAFPDGPTHPEYPLHDPY